MADIAKSTRLTRSRHRPNRDPAAQQSPALQRCAIRFDRRRETTRIHQACRRRGTRSLASHGSAPPGGVCGCTFLRPDEKGNQHQDGETPHHPCETVDPRPNTVWRTPALDQGHDQYKPSLSADIAQSALAALQIGANPDRSGEGQNPRHKICQR